LKNVILTANFILINCHKAPNIAATLVAGDPTTAAAAAATMRGLGDHFHRMAAAGLTANGGGPIFPKQERPAPPPSGSFAEEAANLVMPRHMLFPVHKYFQ